MHAGLSENTMKEVRTLCQNLRIERRKIFMFKMPFGRVATQSGHLIQPNETFLSILLVEVTDAMVCCLQVF